MTRAVTALIATGLVHKRLWRKMAAAMSPPVPLMARSSFSKPAMLDKAILMLAASSAAALACSAAVQASLPVLSKLGCLSWRRTVIW